jgi:ABC-type dipeptide/oligopeptide/nickel transport system ATPase component
MWWIASYRLSMRRPDGWSPWLSRYAIQVDMLTPMTADPGTLSALRIEIGGNGSLPYKSLDHLVWDNIPSFAVLTGLNGSGKTQLLELVAYKLGQIEHPEGIDLSKVRLEVTGDQFELGSVVYIPKHWGFSGAPGLALAELYQVKQQLMSELQESSARHDFGRSSRRAALERYFNVSRLEQVPHSDLMNGLPDDFAFMLDERDVTAGLAHVFLAYRLRAAEAREAGVRDEDLLARLGPPPWDVVNDTFAAADFPFRISSPVGTKILDRYELIIEDTQHHQLLRPMDLSSGEKTLLSVALWLYNANQHSRFPRLLLLDEPDASLHPSMTRQFLSVLKDVLVDRYGARVIMSTHSPSTVALVPAEAIFEMRRTTPRISPSASQATSIGLLTAGLVIVSPGSRHVLVEDNDDVKFYSMILEVLTDYGPTRDPRAIDPAPSIMFLPASLGTGKGKIPGGKSVVMQWLDKLDKPPLAEIFRGVIDRDSGMVGNARLEVLSRYSIENYYVDPIVVYAVLVDQGTAPAVTSVSIPQGQEALLRSLTQEALQEIVDVIGSVVEAHIAPLTSVDVERHPVYFTNGVTLQYPGWLINRRGHELLESFQKAFGGAGVISAARLARGFKRARLVPSELADIMDRLQR